MDRRRNYKNTCARIILFILSLAFSFSIQAAEKTIGRLNGNFDESKIISTETIEKPKLLLIVSEFSNNGSGALRLLNFWRYEALDESFKKVPDEKQQIILSEQSQYKFKDGKLYTADAIIGEGETHFSSHYFKVDIYDFDKGKGFIKIKTYNTDKKYPSLDDVDSIDVL